MTHGRRYPEHSMKFFQHRWDGQRHQVRWAGRRLRAPGSVCPRERGSSRGRRCWKLFTLRAPLHGALKCAGLRVATFCSPGTTD